LGKKRKGVQFSFLQCIAWFEGVHILETQQNQDTYCNK